MDTLAALQRRERMIAIVRWVAAAFAAAQIALYQPPVAQLAAINESLRPWAIAVLAGVVLTGVAAELVLARVRTAEVLERLGAAIMVADVVAALAFVYLYAFDPYSAQWTILVVVPLEAALRFQLRGALAMWASLVPAYLLRDVLALQQYGAVTPIGSTFYRIGLLLLVSLFAGFIARDLDQQRRMLANLNQASRRLASSLEPAEILHALCEETRRCFDARSVVVYAYDGEWFHPVASSPAEDLLRVMDEDRDERVDVTAAQEFLTTPVWLEADDTRPARLAVPLRWPDDPVTNLMVVRPKHGRPSAFEMEAVISLAESAALAIATTRVIAAEQRSNRNLRYLEALRTRFVATIAHDLRMPLTVFKGVSRILRGNRDAIAPEQVDLMLESVERQASRLNRLADDLLDAARLDADRLTLYPGPCDLRSVIAATAADIDDDVEVQADGDLVLVADGARLERILWNLLSNATKYGKPPLQVSAWRDGDCMYIAVRDHGSGLTADQRLRLFSDFAGADDAASVGLGLAIVWQLAAAHGGTVHYEDADPGARFVVTLPVAGPPQPAARTTAAPPGARPLRAPRPSARRGDGTGEGPRAGVAEPAATAPRGADLQRRPAPSS